MHSRNKTAPDGAFKRKSKRRRLMLAAAFALAFAGGCASKEEIRIAVQNDTQLRIMAEMAADLFEARGYPVKIIQVDDGLKAIEAASLSGHFDFYPGYTGEGWNQVLQKTSTFRRNLTPELMDGYEESEQEWIGISDNPVQQTLAVRSSEISEYGINNLSALASVSPKLVLGAPSSYLESRDGLALMKEYYDMNFKQVKVLPEEDLPEALLKGEVDVIPLTTNSGVLLKDEIQPLLDDRMILPEYASGFVVSQAFLESVPEARGVLEDVNSARKSFEQIELNSKVDLDGRDPAAAAREELQAKGLLPASPHAQH